TAPSSAVQPLEPHTPDWVKRAVFYQIFPDRFARGSRTQHARGVQFKPWGASPSEEGFQGGDLYGVAEKLDYLKDLGITAIYLCPLFASAANHRYHTFDYMVVDPLLGGNEALRFLIDEAHARNIKVVLDGVFNHASRGFWAFHHILETGGNSPYLDWFHVHHFPLNPYPKTGHEPLGYGAWWNLAALPKFNTSNPGVRDYLLGVARYWIDFGIDGWRLDVPEEIADPDFWRDFRRTVREGNPEAYIVGEIWHDAVDWLQGDRFDAVMNYVFSRAALGFFGAHSLRLDYKPGGFNLKRLSAKQFLTQMQQMLTLHHAEVTHAQMNLMDSHDTARTLWTLNGDEAAMRLCLLLQMTMPGAPCLYYGDEIGMNGGPDPDCRGAFPWQHPEHWNHDLLAFHQRAIALRHAHPALSVGSTHLLDAKGDLFAFQRDFDGQTVIVIFNRGAKPGALTLEPRLDSAEGTAFADIWRTALPNEEVRAVLRGGKLRVSVPPLDAAIYVTRPAQ
ncbi:MAG: alpha-amylase family glycosyl hydrolase, partial [Caldilineaceae bacterium]